MKRDREEEEIIINKLNPDELFSILILSDYQTVLNFEKASKKNYNLIKDRFVWKFIFERDYKVTFDIINKRKSEFGIKLNAISQNTDHDLWKRFYELMLLPLEYYNTLLKQSNTFILDDSYTIYQSTEMSSLFFIVLSNGKMFRGFRGDRNELVVGGVPGAFGPGNSPKGVGRDFPGPSAREVPLEGNFKSIEGFSRFQMVMGVGGSFKVLEYVIQSKKLLVSEFIVF
jgi:hypothetical protein